MTSKRELEDRVTELEAEVALLKESEDLVPKGLHAMEITDAELRVSKGSGRPFWYLTVKIQGYKNSIYGVYSVRDPFHRLEATCSLFGIRTTSAEIWLDQKAPLQLIGKKGYVCVRHERYNDQTYARPDTFSTEHPR